MDYDQIYEVGILEWWSDVVEMCRQFFCVGKAGTLLNYVERLHFFKSSNFNEKFRKWREIMAEQSPRVPFLPEAMLQKIHVGKPSEHIPSSRCRELWLKNSLHDSATRQSIKHGEILVKRM